MTHLHCLRCKTVALSSSESPPEIQFLECPSCGRRYALEIGRQLTFRWLHPVTLALYGVIFQERPIEGVGLIAQQFLKHRSPEELEWIVNEIRLELNDPTQQVRDTLDCRASEEDLRQFLQLFCDCVELLQPGP